MLDPEEENDEELYKAAYDKAIEWINLLINYLESHKGELEVAGPVESDDGNDEYDN